MAGTQPKRLINHGTARHFFFFIWSDRAFLIVYATCVICTEKREKQHGDNHGNKVILLIYKSTCHTCHVI